jgi:hypothetical protein
MHMMLSKQGLWKFVDGSATTPYDEDQIMDYNEKATKAFALLCEHLTDAQLAHIQYCEMSKALGKHFAVSTKPRPSETSCFFEGGSSPSKCKKGGTCLRTSTW